jgi:methionyl-tRNA synthetase
VLKQLNLPPERQLSLCDETGDLERAKKPWESLPAGHKIGTPEPLFKDLVYILRVNYIDTPFF